MKSVRYYILKWAVYTMSLFIVSHVVAGVNIANWETTIVAALVLGLVNTFIRPFFMVLTLPLNILSMGLLTLFINGFTFYIAAHFVKGFEVADFWSAFWAALIFSVISFALNLLVAQNIGISYLKFRSSGMRSSVSGEPSAETYDIPRSDWHPVVSCNKCGGKDIRFVEPHHEMSVYECNNCGNRFEIDED